MADGGKDAVVRGRIHALDRRSGRGVAALDPFEGGGVGLRRRRDDQPLADEQRRVGVFDAGQFLAGDRVRRDEAREGRAEPRPRLFDDVALGAADVGDDRVGRQLRRQLREDLAHRADRRRDDDHFGPRDGQRRRRRRVLDQTAALRRRQGLRVDVTAGRLRHQAGPPPRGEQRAADHADADQRHPHAAGSRSAACSASTNR